MNPTDAYKAYRSYRAVTVELMRQGLMENPHDERLLVFYRGMWHGLKKKYGKDVVVVARDRFTKVLRVMRIEAVTSSIPLLGWPAKMILTMFVGRAMVLEAIAVNKALCQRR